MHALNPIDSATGNLIDRLDWKSQDFYAESFSTISNLFPQEEILLNELLYFMENSSRGNTYSLIAASHSNWQLIRSLCSVRGSHEQWWTGTLRRNGYHEDDCKFGINLQWIYELSTSTKHPETKRKRERQQSEHSRALDFNCWDQTHADRLTQTAKSIYSVSYQISAIIHPLAGTKSDMDLKSELYSNAERLWL